MIEQNKDDYISSLLVFVLNELGGVLALPLGGHVIDG